MIAFLLGLLKVIGIILLVVLIFLIVVVGIVLFVPICYQGKGQITDEKKEASVRITWLLRALQCGVDYTFPEQPVICIKVFGIDVMKLLEKRKEKSVKKEKSSKTGTKKNKTSKKPVPGVNASLLETSGAAASNQAVANETSKTDDEKTQDTTSDKNKADTKEATNNKEKKATEEVKKPKVSIREKIQTVIDKVKDIIYNINYYIGILQEEDTKQFLADAWKSILKILKSIAPQRFWVKGEFGFETPDTTGKVFGMYAMVMPIVGEYIVLEPDFENQVIRGEVELKGRITIFVIVVNALRIVFDKRLQTLIKKVRCGGKNYGR